MDIYAAAALADKLMREYGLFSRGWKFEFDRAKQRRGQCRQGNKIISLSAPLTQVRADKDVENTLRHEIAHAMVGPGHGHDRVWQRQALAVGAKPERCADDSEPSTDIPHRFTGTCADCHASFQRHRRRSGVWHQPCRYKPNQGRIEWSENR